MKDVRTRRRQFQYRECSILLITERLLFYRRYELKTQNLIFFSPPRNTAMILDFLQGKTGTAGGGFCLVYWDINTHGMEVERIVGSKKMSALRKMSLGRLAGVDLH